MAEKIRACAVGDVEEEDLIRFDHGGKSLIIIHGPDGKFYAADGYCTHEKQHLSEGIVDDFDIECPLHFGAYDYRTGDPTVAPVCVALKTYPVTVEGDDVFVEL